MFTFSLIWLGQLVSLIGSGLTGFALGVWVYQTTGSTTQFSLIYFVTELPIILIAPLAGAIADRHDKRKVMMMSDTGAGLSTVVIALLLALGQLKLWHLYLAMAISSTCNGFQLPAYYASPTLLVPKQQFGRANGMIQLAKAARYLVSPVLAGFLIGIIHLQGIMLVDVFTFSIAILILLSVRFPVSSSDVEQAQPKHSIWQDISFGWRYIWARPGLMFILLFFMITNFTIGLVQVLITPMVLDFANAHVLGRILSLGASGWVLGGALMSAWGGPKRKIHAVLGFELLLGLSIAIAGLRPSPILITLAAFSFFFSVPMITSCSNAIWQVKVDPTVQGRVFAMRGAIAWSSFPLAYLVAGPLSEYVFQPLLSSTGILANSFGSVFGIGDGRGIGLLFVVVGLFIMAVTLAAYFYAPIRLVEDRLPDAVAHL